MGAVRVEGVSKRFGALRALDSVSTEFLPGEVHAILGENGAGKSTLMNVLAGFVTPDSGRVVVDGAPFPLGQPQAIRRMGLSMVHQHFMLVPEFTVAENLALAQLDSIRGLSRVDNRAKHALDIARDVGWEIDPKAKIRDLPVGVQQRIEILKALSDDASVLIFDEPTAVLSGEEVSDLFRVLDRLRGEGKTIILIAHKLAEVMAIADRVTVLRQGVKVATSLISETTAEELAEWMIGRASVVPRVEESPNMAGALPVVTAKDLVVKGDRKEVVIKGISFAIAAGEILGFGGVDGNGQVELAEVLAGIRRYEGGLARPDAVYVPQDRQQDGLALDMSIRDNLWIAGHRRPEFTKGPFLLKRKLVHWSNEVRSRFNIKAANLGDPVSSLSGGNQQKVVVGRSLDQTPHLLIVVNPTRGLDFNATSFVHGEIRRAASEGAAVALFSTDRDELDALAHRKLFLSRGNLYESLGDSLVGA